MSNPIRNWVLHMLGRLALMAGLVVMLGWFVLLVLSLIVPSKAHAEDCIYGSYGCGHEENHQQYKGWTREPNAEGNATSCCHDGDCRPVRARQMEDGRWQWWNGERWSLPVPPEAMLKPDILGDGRSHACGPKPVPYYLGGDQITYCFSPAQMKM